jgi:Ig-like domain-containing protein
MRTKRTTTPFLLIVACALLVALLSACGSSNADATPTMSVDEIYTAAFYTLSAQQATQLALTPPTATASITPSPTLAPPPTLSNPLPFGSATTSAGGAKACDSSVYVNDLTIPDGTVMTPGKKFTKTWTLMNNGTCTWSSSYKLAFVGGEQMGGGSTAVPSSVPAGQQSPVSVDLTAPATAGNYTGTWQLQNAAGTFFGNQITVVIKVSAAVNSADTDTPEPTNTP